jgi:hypothetical protein
MAQHSITIGPEFFAKARNDYDNWVWALVREFNQNGMDCGSSEIHMRVAEESGSTILTVENNGDPMTEDILINKLLCLGGSGKNFEGTTGGFGKAKELLYLCHTSYTIRSGNLRVDGSGADYNLTTDDYVDGTRSTITIEGECRGEILDQIGIFISVAQWSGTFYVNGEPHKADLRKGSPRRDLGFGQVYTNKSYKYRMIVRINGVPMFITSTGLDRCVIVELKGASDEVLTSNRDGLVSPYRNELSNFVTELAVDKRSALRNKNRGPRYIQYRGTKLCHRQALDVADVVDASIPMAHPTPTGGEIPPVIEDGTVIGGVNVGSDAEVHEPVMHEAGTTFHGTAAYSTDSVADLFARRAVATLGSNFLIKNETDLKIPNYYDPGSGQFSTYSTKLVRIWGRIMVEMHRLFDHEAEFSVGFVFDDSTEAEFESGDYGKVYFLNPCKIVEQSSSYSKSFKKRFKLTERDRLIVLGLHEFIHGLGFQWHGEEYAGKLTDLASIVMKNRKRFNWCFA